MILFALMAVPLSCYLILRYTGEREPVFGPTVRGVIWSAVAFVAALAARIFIEARYAPADLFLFFAVRDAYLPYLLGIAGFFLFYSRLALADDRAMVPAMTLFLAAFLTVVGLVEILLDAGFLGVYRVLILPAQRVFLMALTPVLAGVWVREDRIALRILTTLALLGLPALTAISPQLLTLGHTVAGIMVALLVTAAGVVAYLLLRAAYFPHRTIAALSNSTTIDPSF